MAEIRKSKRSSTLDQNQSSPLPEELQEAILTALPVRSLCRFRCVCTHWLSLTHHPSFVARHNHLSPPSLLSRHPLPDGTLPLYLLSRPTGARRRILIRPRSPPLQLRRPVARTPLSNSLHGLVSGCNSRSAFLLNPATRHLALLPPPPHPYHLALAFHPSARTYKLLSLHPYQRTAHWSCSTLTVGADREWKPIGDPLSVEPRGEPVFAHGAVHWIAHHPSLGAAVLAVDVEDDEFRVIPLPEPATVLEAAACELDGRLAVSVHERCAPRMTIWVMKEDKWTRAYVVELSGVGDGFVVPPRLVGLVDGRVLVQCGMRGALYAYDPCSKILELCCESACGGLVFYKESLLSPRKLSRVGDFLP